MSTNSFSLAGVVGWPRLSVGCCWPSHAFFGFWLDERVSTLLEESIADFFGLSECLSAILADILSLASDDFCSDVVSLLLVDFLSTSSDICSVLLVGLQLY